MTEEPGGNKAGRNRTTGAKTNPLRIAAQERVNKALELRKAGVTFALIAEKCGYKNAQHAHKAVKAAILAIPRENAIEARAVELDRLDRLMLGAWERAIKGDTEAGDYILRIMKRRAALAGLDAPTKLAAEVTTRDDDLPRLAALAATLRDRARKAGAGGDLEPGDPGRAGDHGDSGPMEDGPPPGPAQ